MDYKKLASSAIDEHKKELRELSEYIWQNPELNFKEHKAAAALTSFLVKRGFEVTTPYCDLDTAFKAEISNGDWTDGTPHGPHVCVICEYDALPEIGHACGHNLIAEAGVATGLGLQAALNGGLVGRVTVMGTPAEEGGGGKVLMINRGAFEDVDVAIMVHPAPFTVLSCSVLAITSMRITYTGKASHAAAFPWEGLNALDAAVMAYNSISVARQQFKPTWRVHGVITNGGVKPNIIPEKTTLEYYIRAPTKQELAVLKDKMTLCFKAAAVATGCIVEMEKMEEDYDNLITNSIMAETYRVNLESLDVDVSKYSPTSGSTDMGNVTHVVPGIHPMYAVGSGEANHTREFTDVVNTPESHEKTLTMAKAMAYTLIDIMTNPNLLKSIETEFNEQKK
jgi:amidohydrolase